MKFNKTFLLAALMFMPMATYTHDANTHSLKEIENYRDNLINKVWWDSGLSDKDRIEAKKQIYSNMALIDARKYTLKEVENYRDNLINKVWWDSGLPDKDRAETKIKIYANFASIFKPS